MSATFPNTVFEGRTTARREGPFILFLIGMRVHRLWAPWEWLPVFSAMPGMMREVAANPDSGFLGAESFISLTNPLIVQYWKDFDSLLAYAHDRQGKHFPAWARFNREVGANGRIGIWHETYRIEAGACETIYANMPLTGLARTRGSIHAKAEGRLASAKERIRV